MSLQNHVGIRSSMRCEVQILCSRVVGFSEHNTHRMKRKAYFNNTGSFAPLWATSAILETSSNQQLPLAAACWRGLMVVGRVQLLSGIYTILTQCCLIAVMYHEKMACNSVLWEIQLWNAIRWRCTLMWHIIVGLLRQECHLPMVIQCSSITFNVLLLSTCTNSNFRSWYHLWKCRRVAAKLATIWQSCMSLP